MGEEVNNGSKILLLRETDQIIGAAIEVHRQLAPGLLESAYEACLAQEFLARGVPFRRQLEVPIVYKGERVDCGFRLDFLVFESVLLELKSVDKTIPIHEAQLFTYMRLTNVRVGLLINFNLTVLKNGIVRRVL
jgi:GxxExxY protein